jgi:hypothetical protein
MAKDTEPFLARWSRLKREERAPEVPAPPSTKEALPEPIGQPEEAPLPELPPIDQLTPDSDFRPFMDPRVPDALRRMALKKLYADPHFNVQDMLDDFAEDYTTMLEVLPDGMAGKFAHARRTLLGQAEADEIEAAEAEAARVAAKGDSAPPDERAAPAPTEESAADTPESAQASEPGAPRTQTG